MIRREDILSMEYLKKTEFTGCFQGMRYRLEKIEDREEKRLMATVWPEPFNYLKTPENQKQRAEFDFSEEGVEAAVEWMNGRYEQAKELWEKAPGNWPCYNRTGQDGK